MRVLITGSSGQIGTNLALRLQRDRHDVFGVDKRPNSWLEAPAAKPPAPGRETSPPSAAGWTDAFPYLLQDLTMQHVAFEFPPCDAIVHLAAHAKVHELVLHPRRALENTIMTFNVLEYARQRNVPIVFASSREVYGDVHRFDEYVEASADFAFTESTYSASKIAGEAFVYSYARCYGLPYLVFRFSNVYGRYDNDLHRMVRVIPLFIHRLRRGEPITVYGGEHKTLDFTYVDDCVAGLAAGVEALVSGRVQNETINLAYGRGNTLVRVAALIAERLGVEPQMTLAPALLGEVTHYVADLSKARTLLGYEPHVPLEDGVARAVDWFLEHRALHPEAEHLPPADADSERLGLKSYA